MGVTLRVEEGLLANEATKFPYVAACDESDCYFVVSAKTEEQGKESLASHKCPYGGGARPNYPSCVLIEGKARNLHELLWETMDSVIDGIMLAKSGMDPEATVGKVTFMKGRANGLAEGIMWIASPYFEDIKDVSRWAMERFKMRTGQREFEPTVGCDRYDPLRDVATSQWVSKVDELRRRNSALAKASEPEKPDFSGPKPARRRVAKPLDVETKEGIKRAFAIPAMTDEVIANMFSVTVSQIAQMRASTS